MDKRNQTNQRVPSPWGEGRPNPLPANEKVGNLQSSVGNIHPLFLLPTANCILMTANFLFQLRTANLIYRDFRAGDDRHSLVDISKGKNLLGYHLSYRIGKGLQEVLGWYVKKCHSGTHDKVSIQNSPFNSCV